MATLYPKAEVHCLVPEVSKVLKAVVPGLGYVRRQATQGRSSENFTI